MSDEAQPHPLNVPGPFYVLNGCCTDCGVPMFEAPDLFAYDPYGHCYVRKQPEDEWQTESVIEAARCAELECIRYRGNDAKILEQFAEIGHAHLCDSPRAAKPDHDQPPQPPGNRTGDSLPPP